MNAQTESITPTFVGDTIFAIALQTAPWVDKSLGEEFRPLPRFNISESEPRFRGVPDSPLHD